MKAMKAVSCCRREGNVEGRKLGFLIAGWAVEQDKTEANSQFYPMRCTKLMILDLNLQFLCMTTKHSFENWLIYVSVQWSGCVSFVRVLGVLINFKWIKIERQTSAFHLKIPWPLARTFLNALNLSVSWEAVDGSGTARRNVFCSENFCSMTVDSDKFMESLYAAHSLFLKITVCTVATPEQKWLFCHVCCFVASLGFSSIKQWQWRAAQWVMLCR